MPNYTFRDLGQKTRYRHAAPDTTVLDFDLGIFSTTLSFVLIASLDAL